MTQASLKFTNRKSWLEIFKQSFCLSLLNAGLCHKPPILAQFPQKMFSLFYLNPCEYVTRVSRRGTGVELKGQRSWDSFLSPPGGLWESDLVGTAATNGSSCWSLLLCEWDIVRVFSYSGELSFGWWVLVLKSDDSRLKWISHLIQMLAVKNRSFWDRRDGTSVKGTYRCSIQFPASTWHQMELQLSVTPSNALFWPLWCTGIHAGWTSVHLNGWKSPSG